MDLLAECRGGIDQAFDDLDTKADHTVAAAVSTAHAPPWLTRRRHSHSSHAAHHHQFGKR